ncbi:MAG TPA: BlaI/MecI/CopY family transcriptional regulator [archaeon]|nr:BlaI/MecI/CopY family transcriptional regulator [archaeon]
MELSKINFEKEGLGSLVGSLEADVLDGLWHSGEKQSCRQVFDFVKKRNKVAYTTITVTLDRLYAKGLVEREIEKGKGGLKYRYGAKISKEELGQNLSKRFVNFLKKNFGESSIAYLRKNI